MVDVRTAGLGIALSHILRSVVYPEIGTSLSVEINQFRAEIARAELTLTQTTAVLEHCTHHSNFLTYIIKLLAFSELALLVWILYLLLSRSPPRLLALWHRAEPEQSPSGTSDLTSASEGENLTPVRGDRIAGRTGPWRPSDLRQRLADRTQQ